MKLEVFVTDKDVAQNFDVQRDFKIDEDEFQQRCDCLGMSPYDKDIAVLTNEKRRLELSTTSDRWNVYLIIRGVGDDSTEAVNVTSESMYWQTVNDVAVFLMNTAD